MKMVMTRDILQGGAPDDDEHPGMLKNDIYFGLVLARTERHRAHEGLPWAAVKKPRTSLCTKTKIACTQGWARHNVWPAFSRMRSSTSSRRANWMCAATRPDAMHFMQKLGKLQSHPADTPTTTLTHIFYSANMVKMSMG